MTVVGSVRWCIGSRRGLQGEGSARGDESTFVTVRDYGCGFCSGAAFLGNYGAVSESWRPCTTGSCGVLFLLVPEGWFVQTQEGRKRREKKKRIKQGGGVAADGCLSCVLLTEYPNLC